MRDQMTPRDHFACAAMQVLLRDGTRQDEEIARAAYAIAQTMMAERDRYMPKLKRATITGVALEPIHAGDLVSIADDPCTDRLLDGASVRSCVRPKGHGGPHESNGGATWVGRGDSPSPRRFDICGAFTMDSSDVKRVCTRAKDHDGWHESNDGTKWNRVPCDGTWGPLRCTLEMGHEELHATTAGDRWSTHFGTPCGFGVEDGRLCVLKQGHKGECMSSPDAPRAFIGSTGCGERVGSSHCVEPKGHSGPHLSRYDKAGVIVCGDVHRALGVSCQLPKGHAELHRNAENAAEWGPLDDAAERCKVTDMSGAQCILKQNHDDRPHRRQDGSPWPVRAEPTKPKRCEAVDGWPIGTQCSLNEGHDGEHITAGGMGFVDEAQEKFLRTLSRCKAKLGGARCIHPEGHQGPGKDLDHTGIDVNGEERLFTNFSPHHIPCTSTNPSNHNDRCSRELNHLGTHKNEASMAEWSDPPKNMGIHPKFSYPPVEVNGVSLGGVSVPLTAVRSTSLGPSDGTIATRASIDDLSRALHAQLEGESPSPLSDDDLLRAVGRIHDRFVKGMRTRVLTPDHILFFGGDDGRGRPRYWHRDRCRHVGYLTQKQCVLELGHAGEHVRFGLPKGDV